MSFTKFLSFFFVLFVFATAFLSTNSTYAASGNLKDAFNFFGVECLVPDSDYGTPTINSGANYKVRPCKGNSATPTNNTISLLDQAIVFMYQLGPILAVVVVMWGGFLYYNSVFSGDDKRAITTIRAGVIGLAIILSVPIIYGIFQTISTESNGTSQNLFALFLSITVNQIIKPLANTGIILGAAVAVLSLIFAGYQYILGDAAKGIKALQNALIGLIVVLAAVAIVALIQVTANFII